MSVLREASGDSVDRPGYRWLCVATTFGAAAFAVQTLGLPPDHPLVAGAFLVSYPAVFLAASRLMGARISGRRTIGNFVDGTIAALITSACLFEWGVFAKGMRLDVSLAPSMLYAFFDALCVGVLVGFGSMLRWKFPRQVKLILVTGASMLASDVVALFGLPATVSVRLFACAYVFLRWAVTWCDPRWGILEDQIQSRRIFFVSWVAAVFALALLVAPNLSLVPQLMGVVVFVLVVFRLSAAYGQARTEAELRREARTDELTGLQNRRALLEGLNQYTKPGLAFAIMILDLDGFKEVNDTLGHDAGDQLLRTIGERLQRIESKSSVPMHLYRLGGDEFSIITESPESAPELAAEIIRQLAIPTILRNERIDQRVSIGIANFPTDSEHARDLLRLADTAMYRAKSLRSGVESHDPNAVDDFSHIRLLGLTREALAGGKFELHYQPQVSLADGSVVGIEALFRIPYKGGYLPTPAVISAVESTGLLPTLTDLVIDRALRDIKVLRNAQPDLTVSVNVSAQDLSSGTLHARVLPLLQRHGVSPNQLCIEITEESLLQDPASAAATVTTLRESGIQVSMDDFGVGFSSLTNLRLLDVDELKIDRSFVAGLSGNRRTEALVLTIVELAKRLDATVLIEGVEHVDEITMARSMGIDIVQGYVFSKPLPFDQLRKWLSNEEARVASSSPESKLPKLKPTVLSANAEI